MRCWPGCGGHWGRPAEAVTNIRTLEPRDPALMDGLPADLREALDHPHTDLALDRAA